jgi:hypothetical protein
MANICDPRYPQPIQFIVLTKGGRNIQMAAVDMHQLFRDLQEKNITADKVTTLTEYEAEILAKEAQEDLMHQFRMELERELKESA